MPSEDGRECHREAAENMKARTLPKRNSDHRKVNKMFRMYVCCGGGCVDRKETECSEELVNHGVYSSVQLGGASFGK